jgi:BirA family biotin operon repressor/biotin-[acetyl-CoA-carboxylase] ligase
MTIFGKSIHHLETIDSTNNYANHLVQQNLAESGTVIYTDFQTAGKGQRGKIWESNSGENLMCSLVYFPDNMSVDQSYLLNIWAALSLAKLCSNYLVPSKIKWPNDIWVNHKKIGGILIETSSSFGHITSAVIGIGLNVNQLDFHPRSATSLSLETNTIYSIKDTLLSLCTVLNNFPLSTHHEGTWRRLFTAQMYGLHQQYCFKLKDRDVNGKITGISEQGQLELEVNGRVEQFQQGEITLLVP